MAVREPAHPIEKRDLLHADTPSRQKVDAIADQMLTGGRSPESIDYVEITKTPALLARAEEDAVKRGSAWLLHQVDRIRGSKSAPETWARLAESAKSVERWHDAVRALQAGGFEAEAEALRVAQCPDYEPFKPLGK